MALDSYNPNKDFVIIGGGMVGLSLANQLLNRNISKSICIIEKEERIGEHSSGRNSGVIHAGLYYKPNTLKAKVCVGGAIRLKEWIRERNLTINECGKVIIPQRAELDNQLDILFSRGKSNGAEVEIIDSQKLSEICKNAYSPSSRAIWSPNTAVVNPKEILNTLKEELEEKGVKFFISEKDWQVDIEKKIISLTKRRKINYGTFINASGLGSDIIARKFGVGLNYKIIPFKGLYWELKSNCPIKFNTNIYPVPDLKVPFLGVHFTPSPYYSKNIASKIYIGPTAILAMGRENYKNLNNIEFNDTVSNLIELSRLFLANKNGFRKYVTEQSTLFIPQILINSARALIPEIELTQIKKSEKVGIRAQLYDIEEKKLVDDFLCIKSESSLHILNAISPAFTSSFALADEIIDRYLI